MWVAIRMPTVTSEGTTDPSRILPLQSEHTPEHISDLLKADYLPIKFFVNAALW